MLIEVNNKTKNKVNTPLIKKVIKNFFKGYHLQNKEISLAIVTGQTIKKLNQKYLGLNQITDVLTFAGEEQFLGEIILNFAQIKRQAKEFGNNPPRELLFVLVHGLLHLIGYDDKTKAGRKRMNKLTEDFLEKLKPPLPR